MEDCVVLVARRLRKPEQNRIHRRDRFAGSVAAPGRRPKIEQL